MVREKKRIDVVAAVIWDGPCFLAVQRPPGASMAGYWGFPGGKVEPGEERDTALVRELREELDMTPTAFEYWRQLDHDYEHISVRLHFYHVREFEGDLTANEGQRMIWLAPGGTGLCDERGRELEFLPADFDIVTDLRNMQNG